MSTVSTLEHLTAFEDNDRLEELSDRTPNDRVDFRLLYDPRVVNPWSKGPNELTRLYFNADELDDFYVPITFPEQLDADMRSTPIGRPIADSDAADADSADADGADADGGERSWADAGGGDYRIEGNVEIDGHEFDVMWYRESEDAEEVPIVAAEIGEPAE